MNSFNFHNPTQIIFGENKINNIKKHLPKGIKILLTYGRQSIHKNGIYQQIISQLSDFEIIEFGNIKPNPEYTQLQEAVKLIKKEKIDFILAVGGGSVIDATKFIAAAALYDGDTWEMVKSIGKDIKKALPFACVLTLPATGSEMNNAAVISKRDNAEKLLIINNHLFPQFSILDPQVVASLPQKQIVNGIVDAFVHILEQYITYPSKAPIQDGFAETLLKTLLELTPKILENPKDIDVASNFMYTTTLALNGLIGAGVPQDWATHSIGHELTALFDIDHARTLAIIIPGVWEVMFEQKKEKLAQYGKNIWNLKGTTNEIAEQAIEKTDEFFQSLGILPRITDYSEKCYLAFEIPEKFRERNEMLGEKQNITPEIIEQIIKLRV